MMESNFNHAKKNIKEYICLFTYDPIQTLLNVMEYKKITQLELSDMILHQD